jgi:hypothetical protein
MERKPILAPMGRWGLIWVNEAAAGATAEGRVEAADQSRYRPTNAAIRPRSPAP